MSTFFQEMLHAIRHARNPAPSSEKLILAEEQAKIHALMKRESEKRILIKVAAQDPEVAALVEGRNVENPVDQELFLLKKVSIKQGRVLYWTEIKIFVPKIVS